LLKAFAVRAKERYRTVAEMQKAFTNNLTEPAAEQVNLEEIKVQESFDEQPVHALSDQPVIEDILEVKTPQPNDNERKQAIRVRRGLSAKVKVAIITTCFIIVVALFIFVDAAVAREKTIVYDYGTYIGEVRFWKPDGYGTYTWLNGDKYVGEWRNGLRNGQGTYTWLNGNKYVGGWKDGKKNGQGAMTYSNGDKYVGEWIAGYRNGPVIPADGGVGSQPPTLPPANSGAGYWEWAGGKWVWVE